jgi:hypothetical protein
MRIKLFCFFLLFSFLLRAQTYSISPAKTVTFNAAFSNVTIYDIFQRNTGNSKIILKWERVSVNLPAEWGYSMCDLGACHTGIPAGPETMDTVNVGSSGLLGLNIDPGTTAGSGTVKVFVYQDGFRNNGDTLTWYVTAGTTGFAEISVEPGIQIFPNPAHHFLSFNMGQDESPLAVIMDGTGRTVLSHSPHKGTNTVDISSLDKGIYFLKIDLKNKVFFRRIIKE